MKVIALRGAQNTGKSHTINIVYQLILQAGYTQVPGVFRILGNPKQEDVFDVFIRGDVRVGIIGMGDYVKGLGSLKALLQEMVHHGCEVVVCSCQSNPKIENAVVQYSHQWVDKTLSTGIGNERIVNGIDAARCFSFI